jgi:hypothetical protein
MSEQAQEKDSNELLNILLIIIGLLFIVGAVVQFLYVFGVLGAGLDPQIQEALAGTLGGSPYLAVLLGIWALISGSGMFVEQEWALGQAMVVLTVMAVSSIATMIQEAAYLQWWAWLINIAAALLGIVGFIWLLVTTERYD